MKIRPALFSLTVFLATVPLSLGKAEECAPGTSTSGASEKKPTGKPRVTVTQPLARRILGYWVPDEESMKEVLREMMEDSEKNDPAAIELAREMIIPMLGSITFQFTRDTITVHAPEGPETMKYKVLSTDPKSGELKMMLTRADGKETAGSATLEGRRLTLVHGEGKRVADKIVMKKISKQKFEERRKALEAGALRGVGVGPLKKGGEEERPAPKKPE